MFDSIDTIPWSEEGQRQLAVRPPSRDVRDRAIPPDLADLPPGILLSIILSSIDVDALSGHDRVIVMAAHQRMASYHQAHLYDAMAAVADAVTETLHADGLTDVEVVEDACSTEVRAALQLTRRAADGELAVARGFRFRLPEVWRALAQGLIDRRRANLILHRTNHLSPAEAAEVAHRALERASALTTGQLTGLLRRLCTDADPDGAKNRYEAALDHRRVVLDADVDGTASLHMMDLPPDRALRIRDRIDSIARGLRGDGEARTMDQLRADVALDLLDQTTCRDQRRGAVVLTVDLATLAGLTEHAGDLGGYGPVVADVARQVADEAGTDEWRFVVTDGADRAVHVGTTRRRPTRHQRRLVETASPTCIFPGCRVPARQCDLDHRTPWADGGETSVRNLAPLCRHDHRMRHEAGWSYRPSRTGGHEWISPLGHRYTARAP